MKVRMEYWKRHILIVLHWLGAMAVALLLCLLISLCSCKTKYITQEVPVLVEHTTHEKSTELRVDTIFHRDSTIVLLKGDTLVERHYNTIYKVREVVKGDTIRDTIPQVVKVTKTEKVEVEKPLSWWRKLLQWLGAGALAVIAAGAGWLMWRIKH